MGMVDEYSLVLSRYNLNLCCLINSSECGRLGHTILLHCHLNRIDYCYVPWKIAFGTTEIVDKLSWKAFVVEAGGALQPLVIELRGVVELNLSHLFHLPRSISWYSTRLQHPLEASRTSSEAPLSQPTHYPTTHYGGYVEYTLPPTHPPLTTVLVSRRKVNITSKRLHSNNQCVIFTLYRSSLSVVSFRNRGLI